MKDADGGSRWLELLRAETVRRQAAKLEAAGGDARERLYRELDLMQERIRAAPGYVEPTAAEKAKALRDLDQWFAEHYSRG